MSMAAMHMETTMAAWLSPATAASEKYAYTMHMEMRLKKKSPQSRSAGAGAGQGWGPGWQGEAGALSRGWR